MAQWLGQFTGHTHATRVAETEETLRTAFRALETCDPSERPHKEKAIRKIAARLLRARMQFLKAHLVELTRVATAEAHEKRAKEIERMRIAREVTETGGVAAILAEYGPPRSG